MLFSGVRLEACEVVEEAQCLGVEFSGGRGDDRHEPVVLSLKPLVVLGHLGAVGPVECVLVADLQDDGLRLLPGVVLETQLPRFMKVEVPETRLLRRLELFD